MAFRCAHCRGRHSSAREGRDCAAAEQHEIAQAAAELAAEQRAERFFEEGPHGPEPEDPREAEARMLEEERYWDMMIQQREREEDEQVAREKMRRW